MSRTRSRSGAHDAAVARLNELAPEGLETELRRCFGSARWARRVATQSPFADRGALFAAAEEAWRESGRDEWLAAIRDHPRIGERTSTEGRFAATRAWSAGEQAGLGSASEAVRARLAARQRDYEERFGHIFLISATGRTSEEILAALEARMENEPEAEIEVAAGELEKIARLRLEKLLTEIGAEEEG